MVEILGFCMPARSCSHSTFISYEHRHLPCHPTKVFVEFAAILLAVVFTLLMVEPLTAQQAEVVLQSEIAQQPEATPQSESLVVRSVESIHQVSPEELKAGVQVDIECIVTCYERDWAILFIHDGIHGAYAGAPRKLDLQRGDRIRLRGRLNEFRVPIDCSYEPSSNSLSLPEAKPTSFDWLQAGREDSQCVEIEGQLVGIDRDNRQVTLEMRSESAGRFRGLIHRSRIDENELRKLLGQKLRLRGIVGARFDESGAWSGFQVWLSVPENFQPIETGGTFEVPLLPMAELTPERIVATKSNYFRTAGVVTYQLSPSLILMQSGSDQLIVELQKPNATDLDKAYEVTGTLDTGVSPPILRMAELSPSNQSIAIQNLPKQHTIEELTGGDFSGQIVRTEGTFYGHFQLKDQNGFLMQSKGILLPVFVNSETLEAVEAGTHVQVEGVWIQQKSLVGFDFGSCALHARKAGIKLGTQTPWMLLAFFGILALITSASSVWAVTLRRQVHRKSQQFLDSVALQRKTEDRYANIFINARVMVLSTDERGNITTINPAAMRVCGVDESSLLGVHVTSLVAPESVRVLGGLLKSVAASDQIATCQVKLINAETGEVPQEVSCWATQTDGQTQFQLIWHDISDRLRIEKQRAEIEQRMLSIQKMESLGALAGGIAHDFNNLLTVISGNACLLSESSLANEQVGQVESIQTATSRAAELTQQMLAYAGQGHFDIRVIDLSRLIGEMTPLIKASVSKGIEVRLDLQSKLPGVKADATQLKQVLMNLVCNASEAIADQGGRIQIRSTRTAAIHGETTGKKLINFLSKDHDKANAELVCLEVADNGCGIDESLFGSIFDPFFSTKFSGRGLGLSTVVGIIRGHHGCLEVESRVGLGTCFRIYFPSCTDPVTSVPTPHFKSVRSPSDARVIVVDDEPSVLKVISKTLEFAGMQVTACRSGEEALSILRKSAGDFDCLITDQTMPVMSGTELCQHAKRLRQDLPVVLCSGYSVDLVLKEYQAQGISAVLQKPFRSSELIELVSGMVIHGKSDEARKVTS